MYIGFRINEANIIFSCMTSRVSPTNEDQAQDGLESWWETKQ